MATIRPAPFREAMRWPVHWVTNTPSSVVAKKGFGSVVFSAATISKATGRGGEADGGAPGGAGGGASVSGVADPRVDDCIEALPEWQQEICRSGRAIARGGGLEGTNKRSVQPYFVLQGNVAALLAARDHVNVFIYDPLVTDPDGIITHGHGNATGRQIWINQGDELNRAALLAMFREIAERNRAGGWRRLGSG